MYTKINKECKRTTVLTCTPNFFAISSFAKGFNTMLLLHIPMLTMLTGGICGNMKISKSVKAWCVWWARILLGIRYKIVHGRLKPWLKELLKKNVKFGFHA